MDLDSLKDLLVSALRDHWAEALGAVTMLLLGRFWGRRRARRDWAKKQFLHRLMISLNTLGEDGAGNKTLQIRTILEKNIQDVFLNSVAVDKVLHAAEHTTEADPMLPIDPEDRWPLLNAVLNEIAEAYSAGTLAADMGAPVERRRYVICLTNEIAGPVRAHKIRAMMVQKDLLTSAAFEGDIRLEADHHITRVDTLRLMRETLAKRPDLFLDVELVIPR